MTDYPGSGYPQQPNPGQEPPYGAGQPPYGQPQYGPPPGQPQYGPPPGQPQYGPPPGQPPYGPPPGQPLYGPPPGYPPVPGGPGYGPYGPPPGKRSSTPWIIGGAVAVAAVVLVLALGASSDSTGPTAVVGKYLKAAQHNDVKTALAITCDPLHGSISGDADAQIKSYKVGKSAEKGDSASVPFTVVDENGTEQGVAQMKKQSGKWKICDISEGGGSGGGTAGTGTNVPTGLPSDFPTDFATDFPTDFPTGGAGGSLCITPPSGVPSGTPTCFSN